MQGAVLGLPIQLISRMSGVVTGALGSTAGKIVKYGSTASLMIGSVAPYVQQMVEAPENAGGLLGDALLSLVSFMDLNASHVRLIEKKRIALVDIPGRQSDWIQDMGRKSSIYKLKGKFFAMDLEYPGAQTSSMSAMFNALYGDAAVGNRFLISLIKDLGVPVPFMNKLDICEVIIADATFDSYGGKPNWIDYDLTLVEYRRLSTAGKLGGLAASNLLGRL